MTLRTNARVAGVTIVFYIAAGLSLLAVSGRPHAASVFGLLTSFSALVLGVTFYAITRDQDAELAMLGLTCRIIEGIPGTPGTVYFAVGSALFSWLLLRGRMIPVALAGLGFLASVFLVATLFLQRAGLFGADNWFSSITWLLWLPMLVFELTLAAWLIIKGVATPASRLAA